MIFDFGLMPKIQNQKSKIKNSHMSTNQTRLDLQIDVFKETKQQAKVLPNLTPPELIEAILQEFQADMPYLSNQPADYHLKKATDQTQLNDHKMLEQQLRAGDHLILVEKLPPIPSGAQRLTSHACLREESKGNVYNLYWQPAIIGRLDKKQSHNDWVAVNLESYETGLSVSRRHAKITEEKGQYYIEGMSLNPISIKDINGKLRAVTQAKQILNDGEVIHLERSNIDLKFMMRS